MEFFENTVVIFSSDSFGKANDSLDVSLQWTFQYLIHFSVIVIIVADAKHALNIIPNGRAEAWRINVPLGAHKIVRQLVHEPELVVEQVANIVVQPVDEWESVIVPGIILNPKCWN